MKKAEPKPRFYARIEFTYGDVVYIQCWNRTWDAALKQIYREFVMVWSVSEIKESTFKRHKND